MNLKQCLYKSTLDMKVEKLKPSGSDCKNICNIFVWLKIYFDFSLCSYAAESMNYF